MMTSAVIDKKKSNAQGVFGSTTLSAINVELHGVCMENRRWQPKKKPHQADTDPSETTNKLLSRLSTASMIDIHN